MLKNGLRTRYMSHNIINEKITIMDQALLRTLRTLLLRNPSQLGIIADEATDVANWEQFNLSIRWVSDDYSVSEDPVRLFCHSDTTADTIQ